MNPVITRINEDYYQLIEELKSRMIAAEDRLAGYIPLQALHIAQDVSMGRGGLTWPEKRSVRHFIQDIRRPRVAVFERKLYEFMYIECDDAKRGSVYIGDVKDFLRNWLTGNYEEAWDVWSMTFKGHRPTSGLQAFLSRTQVPDISRPQATSLRFVP